MAKGRMLNKIISESRRMPLLSNDTYRLIYTWLVPHLDVEGRFSADPLVIKGKVIPRLTKITPNMVKKALEEMHEIGLITIYEIDGDRFLELRKFKDHQNLRLEKEGVSKILAPKHGQILELGGSSTEQVRGKISKDKISKENIATSKEVPTFFSSIQKYFISAYEKKFGTKPAIDFGKDGKNVKSKANLFASVSEAYKLIDDFLESKKAAELGYTLSICFSSHSINLWRAGKLGDDGLTEDELFEKYASNNKK